VVWSLAGWRWVWSPIAQPPKYPETEPTGLFGFLCGLRFSYVTASHVIVPARPASVVLGCAAPTSGHLPSMASGFLGLSGNGRSSGVRHGLQSHLPLTGSEAQISDSSGSTQLGTESAEGLIPAGLVGSGPSAKYVPCPRATRFPSKSRTSLTRPPFWFR
jgi:hypothetical protein